MAFRQEEEPYRHVIVRAIGIGARLRGALEPVLSEPVPADFLDLLERAPETKDAASKAWNE